VDEKLLDNTSVDGEHFETKHHFQMYPDYWFWFLLFVC